MKRNGSRLGSLRQNPRVYHGSPHLFAMGDGKLVSGEYGPGFYFTTSPDQATKYATKYGGAGRLYMCDVEFKRPLYHHTVVPPEADMETADPVTWSESFGVKYGAELYLLLEETRYGSVKPEAAIRMFRKLGYDGIIVYLRRRVSDVPHAAESLATFLGMPASAAGEILEVVKTPEEADYTYYVAFDVSQVVCEVLDTGAHAK